MPAALPPRTIAFLSDFGLVDPSVGVCHGVIRRHDPAIPIVDITHAIERHDIAAGAIALADSVKFMPERSVFLAVVDPGVGSDRRALALQTADGSIFVGPDNGLMFPATERLGGVESAVEIGDSPWRLSPTSSTFHGRDIFAPVAARLAGGAELATAGKPLEINKLTRLAAPRLEVTADQVITGVVSTDEFGNVRLAGRFSDLGDVFRGDRITIDVAGRKLPAVAATSYADGADGALMLIEDSSGSLSLAVNQGDAAAVLELQLGDTVLLSRR